MYTLSELEIKQKRKLFSESDASMTAAFRVLSDVNRYRIFRILGEQHELSISNIAEILNISLPLASQHIKILTHAKLIQKQKDGKRVFPKLEHNNPFVQAIVNTIAQAKLSRAK